MSSFHKTLLPLALAFTFTTLTDGADWPQWQGPKRNGHSADTGLLSEWPKQGPTLVWTAHGVGGGYSTPAVAGGRVYGMGKRGEDEFVWALDVATGKEVWGTRVSPADRNIGYPEGSRSTPTVDADLVFALSPSGGLICAESATGKEIWKKEFKQDFAGRMMSGWGFSESPLVDGGQVICTPGGTKGTMLALNKKTGDVLWQTKGWTDRAAYASIVPANIGGVDQFVQLTGESVAGVSPCDGRVLWQASRPGRTAVIPTPVVYDNFVYVTSGYGVGCNLFKITQENGKFQAEEVYANRDMVNHHGGVVLVGEHIYGHSDSRGWICQEFKTGNVVWANKGVGKGSIAYANGHLYLRSQDARGAVALIEATPKGYVEKSRFDQPERSNKNSWPHPVIANGLLFLRDQDVLLCYDVKQKAERTASK